MSKLAGTFLVARPALRDPFFGRSVVLLLDHGAEGAFGLVLNRPAQAAELPFPVFIGGPCQPQGLLMLHGHADWVKKPDERPGEVCPGIFVGDTDTFNRLGEMPDDAQWKFRVFTGYAGWGPQQLEGEMAQGAWIVLPASGERLFGTPAEELWERLSPPAIPEPSLN
jgi:putative transcriptional regulator